MNKAGRLIISEEEIDIPQEEIRAAEYFKEKKFTLGRNLVLYRPLCVTFTSWQSVQSNINRNLRLNLYNIRHASPFVKRV